MDIAPLVAAALGLLLVAIVAAAGVTLYRKKQTDLLRRDFGEEYDRAFEITGDERAAERDLRERRTLHDALHLQPLSPIESDRFVLRWREVQSRFVDDPEGAVAEADDLVGEVMRARGYDVDRLEGVDGEADRDVVDLVAVDHPDVVPRYREGRRLHQRAVTGDGGTEDLRQAMVRFRSLFESLVDDRTRTRS